MGFAYGFLLRRFSQESFFICSVDVAEEFRRRGAGKTLVETLAAFARSRGCREMFVFTNASNEAAVALYHSMDGRRPNLDNVCFDFEL